MNKIFIFLTLLGTISGAEVLANGKFCTGARSDADCPSYSNYVGNGFANLIEKPMVGNIFLHVEKVILIAPLVVPIWEKVFVKLKLVVTNFFLQRASGKMNAPSSVIMQEMVFARKDFNYQ